MYILIIIVIILLFIVYLICPNLHITNTVIPFYNRTDNMFPKIKNGYEITILCCSGLSNRIRTILGFLEVCNYYNKKLNVIWIEDNTCNGNFLDYFKPINNVNFINKNKNKKVDYQGQNTIENICSNYNIGFDKKRLYCNIKPVDEIENKIQKYIKNYDIQNIIGIHVRRTDYTGNIIGKILNGSNSDQEFFEYIEKYSNKNFFIATDNKETQDLYINKYKERVLFYSKIKNTTSLRQTSLENAVIDIYILSYNKRIKGTYNSSFTEFARYLKKSR